MLKVIAGGKVRHVIEFAENMQNEGCELFLSPGERCKGFLSRNLSLHSACVSSPGSWRATVVLRLLRMLCDNCYVIHLLSSPPITPVLRAVGPFVRGCQHTEECRAEVSNLTAQ